MHAHAAPRLLLIAAAVAGALAIAWTGALRISQEAANGRVGLAVDYVEIAQAAAQSGTAPRTLLDRLRRAGVTHVAISEQNLEQALAYARAGNLEARRRAMEQLRARLPGLPATLDLEALPSAVLDMGQIGVGYDPEAIGVARDAGLAVLARPLPDYLVTPVALAASLDAAKATGATVVIFAGAQVLGYRGLIETAADGLASRGLTWGMIELARQQGERRLAQELDCGVVRVHSITAQEMVTNAPAEAIQRFSLAVRERKVRLCYVRLSFIGDDPAADNVEYLAGLAASLRGEGFALGEPRPYDPLQLPPAIPVFCALAVAAAVAGLVLMVIGAASTGARWLLGLAVAGALGVCAVPWGGALLAALIFPLFALLLLRERERPHRRPVWAAMRRFVALCAISAFGGLLAAAFLTQTPYLLSVETFRGVKLAVNFPILLVGLALAARSAKAYRETRLEMGEHAPEWPALWAGLREQLGYAVRYWQAFAILFGLGLLAVLVMRTGNEAPLAPSGLEMKLRALLDVVLGVRPRTKEIFFGHPLMLVSLVLLLRGQRRGVWLGLAAGMVGQTSITNTFCHLHTPLLVSLVRAGHGMWLGLMVGLVVWGIVAWSERRATRGRGAGEGR